MFRTKDRFNNSLGKEKMIQLDITFEELRDIIASVRQGDMSVKEAVQTISMFQTLNKISEEG